MVIAPTAVPNQKLRIVVLPHTRCIRSLAPSHPPAGMGGWAAFTADLLLPRRCAACETWLPLGHDGALCADCWSTLQMPVDTLCGRCGIPVPPPLHLCAACAT